MNAIVKTIYVTVAACTVVTSWSSYDEIKNIALTDYLDEIPFSFTALPDYNLYHKPINTRAITQFLNEQINELEQQFKRTNNNKVQVNAHHCYYFVATGQEWQVIPIIGNRYILIIPDGTATFSNRAKQKLFSYFFTPQPEPFAPNIIDLNALLSQPNYKQTEKYQLYRLAVRKAFLQAKGKLAGQYRLLTEPTFTYLAHALDAYLPYAATALSYIVDYVAHSTAQTNIDYKLDLLIIGTADISLIKAHLKQLEQELKDDIINKHLEKVGIINLTKKRIDMFQHILKEDQLELQLMQQMMSKKK